MVIADPSRFVRPSAAPKQQGTIGRNPPLSDHPGLRPLTPSAVPGRRQSTGSIPAGSGEELPEDGADQEKEQQEEVEDDFGVEREEDMEQEEFQDGLEGEEDFAQEYPGSEEDEVPNEEEDDQGSQEEVEEEEEEAVEEDDKREDDLALNEVPEDQREAVQGNLVLKKLLSSDAMPPGPGQAKKRRRVEPEKELEPVKAALLKKWRVEGDVALRYVVGVAETTHVETVSNSSWTPRRKEGGKSCAEQVHEKLIRVKEEQYPPGQRVDVIGAFRHRWKLDSNAEKQLRELNHKDLRHVMEHYDGEQAIEDLAGEAAMSMPDLDDPKTADAAPDKPGALTMGRMNRLELIDPIADALIVGDANLTFSELLAKHREGLGHVGRVVATTFETIETLRERYKEIDRTVKIIEDLNGEVLHNVDCTRLAVDPRFRDMTGKFGAVYYNFPHAGVVKGFFDGHPFVRWRHENLMHLFFCALRTFVKPGGVVKVASNANATGVRFSDIMSAARDSEFVHVETLPFIEWQLRSYLRSYGDRRDANRRPAEGDIYRRQTAGSDMVYFFRYSPSGTAPPKPHIRYPPTRQHLVSSNEGNFRGLSAASRKRKVEEIYKLFMSYVQGIHVG